MSTTRQMTNYAFSNENVVNEVSNYINGLTEEQAKKLTIAIAHSDGAVLMSRDAEYKNHVDDAPADVMLVDKLTLASEDVNKVLSILDNLYTEFCSKAVTE